MEEFLGNIWDFHDPDSNKWVAITTNGIVRWDGKAIMGRGIALQAAQRFPQLPYVVGTMIGLEGNRVFDFPEFSLYSLPVKHHWRERASLDLIRVSCYQLAALVPSDRHVFLVRPGCGAGGLNWDGVKREIEPLLDDRFTVVDLRR